MKAIFTKEQQAEKARIRAKDYYKNNKKKCLLYSKKYRSLNRDIIIKRRINYYARNKKYIIRKTKDYVSKNRNKVKKYQKIYRNRPYAKINQLERQKQQRIKHKLKFKARELVHTALRNCSILKLPCEICGIKKSEAHHSNYNRPLQIKWLCRLHHEQEHGRMLWK